MGNFKPLKKPEQEGTNSCHCGKWFVFIDNDYHNYDDGNHLNFLHHQGQRLCQLETEDSKNCHIMFDTEEDAFFMSVSYYVKHGKEFEYPWWPQYTTVLRKITDEIDRDYDSQVMRFD